jgi:hypothetical protein
MSVAPFSGWIIGLVTVLLLWRQKSSEYYGHMKHDASEDRMIRPFP